MQSQQYSNYSPTSVTGSQARQPRALVLINNISVLWIDIEVTTTTFYVADSYHFTIPLYGQPNGFDMNYLATQASLNIQIFAGFPADPDSFTTTDLELLIVGVCDQMTVDPLNAQVTFAGRDLTSHFIDTKTFAKYPNQTASTIVTNLAASYGLGTSRITATQGNVGTLYAAQNTLMTRETAQWDLITFLAQSYNYVVYVEGNDLVFGPKPTLQTQKPYLLQYQPPNNLYESPIFNGMSLSMVRSFTLVKDVTVKVRVPFSPQTGRAFTATAGKKNPTINSANAGNQIYTFTYPGLTNAQALATAQQLLAQITLNEIKLNASLPGDNILKKSSIISLIGTNTRFDQVYYTDTVVRTITVNGGYHMDLSAKNLDVNSQVTL